MNITRRVYHFKHVQEFATEMINAGQIHKIILMLRKIAGIALAKLLRNEKEGTITRFHVDNASYLWYQIVAFLTPNQLKRHLGLFTINSGGNNIRKVG